MAVLPLAELVALPASQPASLLATTSFEFLIRKPPCNYWINVNYESWLGLRHHRTRVELSLSLFLSIYPSFFLTLLQNFSLSLSLSPGFVPSASLQSSLSASHHGRGLGIIKIRWLICKFNKITVLGMPDADKRSESCYPRTARSSFYFLLLLIVSLDQGGTVRCYLFFDGQISLL